MVPVLVAWLIAKFNYFLGCSSTSVILIILIIHHSYDQEKKGKEKLRNKLSKPILDVFVNAH